jgi:hypothetical protein
LRSEVPLALAPKSTLHYPLTAALKKGDRGTVALQSSVPGALIAQSVVYYIDCKTKQSQTAYSSELRAPGEATQLGSVNTNLRMKNLLTVINTTAERVGVNAGIVLNGGARRTTAPLNATSLSASVTALSDQPFSLAPNSLGVTAVTVDRGASVVSELLRMREDKNGGMDFVVATPLR